MDIMCTKNTQNFKCEEQKTRTELSNWGNRGVMIVPQNGSTVLSDKTKNFQTDMSGYVVLCQNYVPMLAK